MTSRVETLRRPVNVKMIAEMEAKEDSRSPTPDRYSDRERSFESETGESQGGRESRSFSRASMWKRRDDSWDKKWKNQVQYSSYVKA